MKKSTPVARPVSMEKRDSQQSLFHQMCAVIGAAGVAVAVWFGTFTPVVVALTGIACILSFMNGLS